MKLLRIVLALTLLAVLALLGGAALSPASVEVERSLSIPAPPAAIHPWIDDLGRWPEWTAWGEKHPEARYSYPGARAGAGAVQRWEGGGAGAGRLEITASDPEKGVWYDLYFGSATRPVKGVLQYERREGLTEITWTMRSRAQNPLERLLGPLIGRAVARDFERGLARLRERVTEG